MLRANRFALAAALDGAPLEPAVWALHGCDNPVCVRVSQPGETGLLRVVGGSQRDNVLVMARAGRGGGRTMVGRGQAGPGAAPRAGGGSSRSRWPPRLCGCGSGGPA